MTARYSGFIVTQEETIRGDDAEGTIKAIEQIKGVLSVKPVVENIDGFLAGERVRAEIRTKCFNFFLHLCDEKVPKGVE